MSDVNWRGYRIAAWLGILVMVGVMAQALVRGNFTSAFFFIGALGCLGLLAIIHNRLPALFSLILVIAAILSAAGWAWDWYHQIVPYDEIAHAVSIMALTLLAAFYLYDTCMDFFRDHLFLLALTLVSLGLAIGAIWEVVEFFFVLQPGETSLRDTIIDLVVDCAGALIAVPLSIWALKQSRRRKNEDRKKFQ